MMKLAIATITCGAIYEEISKHTHPTIKSYAKKIGADFHVWNQFDGHAMPHYQKLEISTLLETYERVLYIDTDIIVNPSAPSIFDHVPVDCFGAFDESPYQDRRIHFVPLMREMGLDPFSWNGEYYNTGVMVVSSAHRTIFSRPSVEFNIFYEQSYLNVNIATQRPKMFKLHHQWNRMPYLDQNFFGSRLDSYFHHYAGVAIGNPDVSQVTALIEKDLHAWGVINR